MSKFSMQSHKKKDEVSNNSSQFSSKLTKYRNFKQYLKTRHKTQKKWSNDAHSNIENWWIWKCATMSDIDQHTFAKYWLSRLNSAARSLFLLFINLSRIDFFLPLMWMLNCKFLSMSSIRKMSHAFCAVWSVILRVAANENCTGSPCEKTVLHKSKPNIWNWTSTRQPSSFCSLCYCHKPVYSA